MTTDNNGQEPSVGQIEEREPASVEVSGAQNRRDIPGSEGFYTSGSGGGAQNYNPAEEMISFPIDDPGRYLPRANIPDEKYLRRQVAMRSRIARMYTGFEDPLFSYWFYLAGSVAIGGQARKQFVVISTGDRQVEIAGKSGGLFGGMAARVLGNNPQNNNLSQ